MTVDQLSDYLETALASHPRTVAERNLRAEASRCVRWKSPSRTEEALRKLGVPTVLDRWIQQAVIWVLRSSGTGRFLITAMGSGRDDRLLGGGTSAKYIAEGYGWCVDFDLEKFFDRVNPTN